MKKNIRTPKVELVMFTYLITSHLSSCPGLPPFPAFLNRTRARFQKYATMEFRVFRFINSLG